MATKNSKKNKEVQIDFKDSIKAIKGTAKTVNTQSKKIATEVYDDLKANGERISDYAVTKVKEAYNKTLDIVQENTNVDTISTTAKQINNRSLKIADSLVEGIVANSDKWQKLADKAVKNGLKISAKQQDLFFEAMEDIKGQMQQGMKRFKKIFSAN